MRIRIRIRIRIKIRIRLKTGLGWGFGNVDGYLIAAHESPRVGVVTVGTADASKLMHQRHFHVR